MSRTGDPGREPRIYVTVGCPRGIGPEVTAKALAAPLDGARVTVLARPERLAPFADVHERVDFAPIEAQGDDDFAAVALAALTAAARRGDADAIVTGPLHKAQLDRLAPGLPGQTEWCHRELAVDEKPPLMCFVGGPFVLGLVTAHLPLREVAAAITEPLVVDKARRLLDAARAVTGAPAPRLAILGLNPHAGEGGRLGDEDERVLAPAVRTLRAEGHDVAGPLPADGFFARARGADVQAVLAAYHDQGLAPYKLLTAGAGVNLTWGLKVPRTSPDHGTADDIAGQGVADARSMRAALELAARLGRA